MAILHARVTNGRFVVEEAAELPEGTSVQLALLTDDGSEDLTAEERVEIEAAIDRGREQIRRGEGIPAEEVLRRIRAI